jgi:ureidoacrylate peracid hydrolase
VSRSAEGGLAAWIDPRRTALLIVDMQVDFAAPYGAMARAGADLTAVPAALAAATRLAAAARKAGAVVVFVGLQTSAETDPSAWTERTRRLGEAPGPPLCRAGEAGAAFFGPAPEAGEAVITKSGYSAFFGTDLDARLRGAGVDTVIVCGLTTECCVDGTVRDAFQLGYHVFVAADACAAYEGDLHAAVLRILALNCAILAATDEIVAAWRGA